MNPILVGWVGVAVAAIGMVLLAVFWSGCTRFGFSMTRWQVGVVGTLFVVGALLISADYRQHVAQVFA